MEARGEEPPCDQLSCEETVCTDDAGTRVEESLSDPSTSGDSSSVDRETRGEEPQCEQQSGDSVGPEAPTDSSSSVPGESPTVSSDWDEDSPLAHVTKVELQECQEQDLTLQQAREVANPEERDQLGEERVGHLYRDGLLYHGWRPKGTELGDVQGCEQLVLPQRCRSLVLRLAHDILFTGHLGITKTKDRIMQRYYWPGIFSDIAKYCRTCQVCQKSGSRHAP